MKIRTATIEDLPEVERLWRAWWDERPLPHQNRDSVLEMQSMLFRQVVNRARPGVALVVPECAVLLWVGLGDDLHGYGIYVTPQSRGQGAGAALLAAGLKAARLRGFRRILLSPYADNPRVLEWLKSNDFEPTQVMMMREV